MVRKRALAADVPESTPYESYVDRSEGLTQSEPPPPENANSTYPFELKVHFRERSHVEAFAHLIGKRIKADQKKIVFTPVSRTKPENCVFVETRAKPKKSRPKSEPRLENRLWTEMVEFENEAIPTYLTLSLLFRTPSAYRAFARLVKQALTLETQSIWYPPPRERNERFHWVSTWDDHQPRYPIYIVSKGRADTRYTARALGRMGVPYFITIEPQDYDAYSVVIPKERILVLPFSNHGDGPGRARNWCWDHAQTIGHKRHWVLDDNIVDFWRLHQNQRIRVADGGIFRAAEDFVDRFENVPIAGFQYRFFCAERSSYPPFVLNTRIYSCLLIDNACRHRWRGRYNEDTDLSLRVLKDGDCTIQFNAFLQNKLVTQAIGGGNTAEFYASEGTWNKSKMLQQMHPDVAKVVWRYGRWHHEVDYRPFRDNKPILKADCSAPSSYEMLLASTG